MDALEECREIAMWFIERFGWLFANEHEFAKQGLTGEERRKARLKRSRKIMDSIKKELEKYERSGYKRLGMNIGSEDSALDYAFMFSALESCDINHLSPEAYLRKLILGLHEKKVEKKQLLPCYIGL